MSTEIKINLGGIEKKVKDLGKNNTTLKVGFLGSKEATIALQNEYGGIYPVSPEYKARAEAKGIHLGDTIDIIPRPFMHTTVKNNSKQWQRGLKQLIKTMPANQALKTLGEKMVLDIQKTITSNDFEENPAHIAKIKGRSKPLIDSGDMLKSVAYEIIE